MRCQEAKQILYTYLDGNLGDDLEKALFIHLSHCQNCRQDLNHARQTHALLEKYCIPEEPPQNFARNVLAAIDDLEKEKATSKKIIKANFNKKKKTASWNIKRLSQVASVAMLATVMWWASFSNFGPQLARTPEPEELPGTETGEKLAAADKRNNDFKLFFERLERKSDSVETDSKDLEDKNQPRENLGAEEIEKPETEGDNSSPKKPVEEKVENPTPKGDEEKTEPLPEGNKPTGIHENIPDPTIKEPTGPIVAAGIKDNEVKDSSVLLKRISLSQEGNKYQFVSPNKTNFSTKGIAAYGKEGNVYIKEEQNQEEKLIAQPGGNIQKIAWSHQGNRLAANVAGSKGQQGLWVGDIEGNWQLITDIGGGGELLWSPDGQKIAFTDYRGMVYVQTFKEGKKDKLYPITPEPGVGGAKEFSWSVESNLLLMKWAPADETLDTWLATLPN